MGNCFFFMFLYLFLGPIALIVLRGEQATRPVRDPFNDDSEDDE